MKLRLQNELLFVSAKLTHNSRSITLDNVLIDTGSAATHLVEAIGLRPELDDFASTMFGIGGEESVVPKQLDRLEVGEFSLRDFEIQITAMNYGIDIDGIIGLDFLLRVGAVIDLAKLELRRE